MTERRGGLGRGLASLIPTGPPPGAGPPSTATDRSANAEAVGSDQNGSIGTNGSAPAHGGKVAGAVYREVPITAIKPNPKQPRQVFDEDALAELEHSIPEFGLMQPIV